MMQSLLFCRDRGGQGSASRGKGHKYQPSLSAVDESSLEHEAHKQRDDDLLPDEPFTSFSDADESDSLTGDASVAPSPFALQSQEAYGELGIDPSDARRGSFERLSIDASSEGTEKDSVIASSIKTAMSQLRAASMPAALIRPPQDLEADFPEVSHSARMLPQNIQKSASSLRRPQWLKILNNCL